MFIKLHKLIAAKSEDEDLRRREFILNILLSISIFLFTVASIISAIASIAHPKSYEHDSISTVTIFAILSFFILLYFLSRKGFFYIASYFLIAILFLFASYMGFRWGVDLPVEILFYSMIIVMSGILISTRFAFIVTFCVSATIITIGHLHNLNIFEVNRYWSSEMWRTTDMAIASILFFAIATVSWLSNREIEKSLARARKAEADLKKERDSLEMTVEQKTKELRETEMDKIAQLYRFAEFGRLSAGLFHDLMNPLNSVSLNMEKVKSQEESLLLEANKNAIKETKANLERAISSAKKMEDFIVAVRKQISKQANKTLFSLTEETKQVISVLSYKAQKANVKIIFSPSDGIETVGDAVKFNQAALNLIANAIDAYLPVSADGEKREALVSLQEENGTISFIVKDYGTGIPKENIGKIFEPFFTTKNYGMGIGLSMVKRIIEKDFNGTIKVESAVNIGTMFTIKFPKTRKDEKSH